MWSPSNRTPRAPSRGALKLFEKFEQRQPPSPKRRLSASRRVAKNQCADKGFPIADRRRVRERQFALSCLSSSLVSSVHNPILKRTRSLSGMLGNAIAVMAEDPLLNCHRLLERKSAWRRISAVDWSIFAASRHDGRTTIVQSRVSARSINSGASRQGTARLLRTEVCSPCSSASTDVTAAT